MRRFHVPPALCRSDAFELPEREARHAVQVLRLAPGDELTVLDGAGGVLTCVVESAGKRALRVAVRRREHRPPLPCAITLFQALPKGPAFETIVQKATELGAARIVPLISERTVAQPAKRDAAAKVSKWEQIALESLKQCGSAWSPAIEPPTPFTAALRRPAAGCEFVASLEPDARSLRELRAVAPAAVPAVAVWIGPEGDFSPAEYAALRERGVRPITLGPLVLRADTAALAALAVLNHEFQPAPNLAGQPR